MQENEAFEPQIKIVIVDKLSVRFKTPADIAAWTNEELKLYSNIMPAAANEDGGIANLWDQIRSWFNQFTQERQNLINNGNSTTEQFKAAIDRFLNRYTSGNLIYSQSSEGLYVAKLATSEPQLAARLLALLCNVNFPISLNNAGHLWLRASVISEGLRRGWIDQKPTFDVGLEKFRQDWESNFQAVEADFQSKVTDSTNLFGSLTKEQERWIADRTAFVSQSGEALAKTNQELRDVVGKSTADIENFKQTYNAALALRAPTQYWFDKASDHRKAAFSWLLAFGVIAAAGFIGCWAVFGATAEALGKDATYTTFLPTIGAAALSAWCLRICSRQALSNFALGADARERVAMVKTYLALSEGGHATDNERGLILSAIFRPSSKSNDDAAPPTWFDLISKDK